MVIASLVCVYCFFVPHQISKTKVRLHQSQLAYFADQSDTTHVPHRPTAVA